MTPSSQPAFSDSIAVLYQKYMVPMLFAPYAEVVAQRLDGAGGRLLETAAGTGVMTRQLAAVSDRLIVATDLSPAMLELAKAEVPAPNVEWIAADAQALPFANESFDAVVCQFGAMFFPDKPKAFGEAHRVLRADGRFVLLLWDRLEENEFPHAVTEALRALFPDNPPEFMADIPHGYYDQARIEADLRSGGFSDVSFETLALRSAAGSAADAVVAFCAGTPLRNEIEARAPGQLAPTIDLVAAALRRRFGEGPIDGKMQAFLVEARR